MPLTSYIRSMSCIRMREEPERPPDASRVSPPQVEQTQNGQKIFGIGRKKQLNLLVAELQ